MAMTLAEVQALLDELGLRYSSHPDSFHLSFPTNTYLDPSSKRSAFVVIRLDDGGNYLRVVAPAAFTARGPHADAVGRACLMGQTYRDWRFVQLERDEPGDQIHATVELPLHDNRLTARQLSACFERLLSALDGLYLPVRRAAESGVVSIEAPKAPPLADDLRTLRGLLEQVEAGQPEQLSALSALAGQLAARRQESEIPSTPPAAPPAPPMAEALRGLIDRTGKLAQRLGETVLGQDAAIAMVADGYFHASLQAPGDGPRGIFTFLGPPGVGKTLLAETFARVLPEIEGRPVAFRRFDMGGFAGPQNFEQLLGAEEFYKGSRAGTLTGFVHENPNAVVLFDEVEKAHETTQQALLAVLDKGEAADKALRKVVSFAGVWMIFTTNLGREFFGGENETGILGSGEASAAVAFDALASARRRVEVGDREAPAALSKEFVSRLAKGSAAIFSTLEPQSYLQLVESALLNGAKSVRPSIRADEGVKLLWLLSLLPDIEARRVVSRAQAWVAEVVRRSYEECGVDLASGGASSYAIELVCGPEGRAYLKRESARHPSRLLLVDDDDHLPAILNEGCADLGVEIQRVGPSGNVIRKLQRFRADLVLLDLSMGEPPGSAKTERGLKVLERIRSGLPNLPVYVFSEDPDRRTSFDRVVGLVLQRGGARGFIPRRRGAPVAPLDDEFVGQVRRILEQACQTGILSRKLRARQRVSFSLHYHWDEQSSRIVGEVQAPLDELAVSAQDRAAPIHFAGIPPVRFDDVIGLERAKRRLREALEWIRNPDALAAFGVRPPCGFLLAGAPGTGKTLIARALAGEAGLPFLSLSAGELLSKWYGGSEARIRELFAMARRYAPAIVFIDEIDAMAERRDGVRSSGAPATALDQLLACLDGFRPADRPVFVLAATNRPGVLDPALCRPGRFDETIPIDLPNALARRVFFDVRFRSTGTPRPANVDALVAGTSGCTPAELDRIFREAAYLAAANGRPRIAGNDLDTARRLVVFGATNEAIEVRPEELRATALHEAGHALVHMLVFPDRSIDYVTIVPTERGALGYVAHHRDETRHDTRREDVRKQLAVYLAGREAELLTEAPGDAATTGCSSDLEQATGLAYRAIGQWGFDDQVGLVSGAGLPAAAREALDRRVEERLGPWLAEGATSARQLLAKHRAKLEALAAALLAKESLGGDELRAIVAAASAEPPHAG